jgi:hypothetical protein
MGHAQLLHAVDEAQRKARFMEGFTVGKICIRKVSVVLNSSTNNILVYDVGLQFKLFKNVV